MKRVVVLLAVLAVYASAYGRITQEYGYYQDSKNKKVFQMFCDIDVGRFTERVAVKKNGVYIPDANYNEKGYMSGSCSFVKAKLDELVKQKKLKRVQ